MTWWITKRHLWSIPWKAWYDEEPECMYHDFFQRTHMYDYDRLLSAPYGRNRDFFNTLEA